MGKYEEIATDVVDDHGFRRFSRIGVMSLGGGLCDDEQSLVAWTWHVGASDTL